MAGDQQHDLGDAPYEVADVACTLCGCVCDDLRVTVRSGRITAAAGACSLAEPWFLRQSNEPVGPVARVAGRAVTLEAAIDAAATLLRQARAPLIYGLSRSSTPGQRAATALADQLGATIDTTASRCHAPSIMALQEVGESTCSLGEIKQRSDLVIYWGSNPLESHPRHLERYAWEPEGLFVGSGRPARHLAVVDVQPTATSAAADTFVQVERDGDFEVIWALRALLREIPIAGETFGGVPRAQLVELAERMRTCRSGVIFFGLGVAHGPSGHRTVEALLRLVTDLNRHTRFYARRMRILGDVAGADSVLCWQTGFPFSVNLARGYPRYSPGEYSANELLAQREVDVCLLVGSEGVAHLSPAAQETLHTLPVIALDYPGVDPSFSCAVQFQTAIYGLHRRGTAYRMDEVPIPLRPVMPSPLPSDDEVLSRIGNVVAAFAKNAGAG